MRAFALIIFALFAVAELALPISAVQDASLVGGGMEREVSPLGQNEVAFTLDDLIAYGIGHNPAIARLRISVDRTRLSRDLGLYITDPLLSFSSSAFHRESPGASSTAQGSGVSSTEGLSFDLSFTKPFESGDRLTLSHSLYTSSVDITGIDIPTTWGERISASYTWQILKDRGKSVNLLSYYTGENLLSLKEGEIENDIRALSGAIATAYFNIAYLAEASQVEKESLEYYERLLERNVERYKVGLGLKSEVLQAENAKLTQEASVVGTESSLEDTLQSLYELIGYTGESPIIVAPLDVEGFEPSDIHEKNLWNRVINSSFELLQIETEDVNLDLNEDYLRNQLLPDIDVTASASTQGEDEDFAGSFGELTSAQSYSLTLTYNLPWGKRDTKNRLEDNLLQRKELKERRRQIVDALRTRYESLRRELSTTLKTLELQESSVAVAEENAAILRERQRVGLATTLDVLDAEKNLLNARLAYLKAISDHKRAEYDLLVHAGIVP